MKEKKSGVSEQEQYHRLKYFLVHETLVLLFFFISLVSSNIIVDVVFVVDIFFFFINLTSSYVPSERFLVYFHVEVFIFCFLSNDSSIFVLLRLSFSLKFFFFF